MGIVFPWFIQFMVRLMGTTPKGMVNRKQWKPFIFIHIHCSTFEIDDFGFGDYLASRLFLDGSRHGEYSLFWSIAHGVLCRMWSVDTNMSWQYGGTQHSHPRGDKFKWPKTNTYKYSEPKPLENQSNHSSMPPCHLHQVWHSNLTPVTSHLSKQHPLQGIGPSRYWSKWLEKGPCWRSLTSTSGSRHDLDGRGDIGHEPALGEGIRTRVKRVTWRWHNKSWKNLH